MNLENYLNNLVERDGVFFSKKESKISYPESGNGDCFQIEENSFWFKHRNNCIVESVKKHSPESVFFDVGGGNGFVAKGLENNGIPTVLLEPGIQGCFNAKKRNLKNVVCSTLENASINQNTIPAIGLFDVVEHIEDDFAFLKTVNDFLKQDGLVFITVPAYKTLWSNDDVVAGHFRRYTLKRLENVLKRAGFSIEYSTYIFSILPIPVYFFRALPSKLNKIIKNTDSKDLSKYKTEHENKEGFIGKFLSRIWNLELGRVRNDKKIAFGGSCFVVAKKIRS